MKYQPKTIKPRPAYQLGNKLYKTVRAAARAQAWNWIGFRYDNISEICDVTKWECSCFGEDVLSTDGCEIHDHKHGYFARLAKRLTRFIEKAYAESAAQNG